MSGGVSTGKARQPGTIGRVSAVTSHPRWRAGYLAGGLKKSQRGRELEWFLLEISKVLGLEIYLWRVS